MVGIGIAMWVRVAIQQTIRVTVKTRTEVRYATRTRVKTWIRTWRKGGSKVKGWGRDKHIEGIKVGIGVRIRIRGNDRR